MAGARVPSQTFENDEKSEDLERNIRLIRKLLDEDKDELESTHEIFSARRLKS